MRRLIRAERFIESFLRETLRTHQETIHRLESGVPIDDGRKLSFRPVLGGYQTSNVGMRALTDAAREILREEKLRGKLTIETAVKLLDEALKDEWARLRAGGDFKEHRAVLDARLKYRAEKLFSGRLIFPIIINFYKANLDLQYGPVRIIDKSTLNREFYDTFNNFSEDEFKSRLLEAWNEKYCNVNYFVVVEVADQEYEIAADSARKAANHLLNLIRLLVGSDRSDRIRIIDDPSLSDTGAQLAVDNQNAPLGVITYGGKGVFLPDDWDQQFVRELGPAHEMIKMILEKYVRGDDCNSPSFERINYADHLIAEAYRDGDPRMKLVKWIAAFEALCVIGQNEKSKNISFRCGLALWNGNLDYYRNDQSAIEFAYRMRNAIVHGDSIPMRDVARAVQKLDKIIFQLYLHLVKHLVLTQMEFAPQSIKALRRNLSKRYQLIAFQVARQSGLYVMGGLRWADNDYQGMF